MLGVMGKLGMSWAFMRVVVLDSGVDMMSFVLEKISRLH